MTKLTLHIRGLNAYEAKELLEKLREIERRNPDRMFLCTIDPVTLPKSIRETVKLVEELFPRVKEET